MLLKIFYLSFFTAIFFIAKPLLNQKLNISKTPYVRHFRYFNCLVCFAIGYTFIVSPNTLALELDAKPFISEVNFRGSLHPTKCIQPDKIQNYEPNTNWCGRDQWIEITNPSSKTVSLDGWQIELRHGKIIDLSSLEILAGERLTIGFTQQNFYSIIPKINLRSYQMLYLSSDSDKNPANHNMTVILKNKTEVVDSLNLHLSTIDPDYLNSRGHSYERCSPLKPFIKSKVAFLNLENNFGTPGLQNPDCPTAAKEEAMIITKLPGISETPNSSQILENPTTAEASIPKLEVSRVESTVPSELQKTAEIVAVPIPTLSQQVETVELKKIVFTINTENLDFQLFSDSQGADTSAFELTRFEPLPDLRLQAIRLDPTINRQYQAIFGFSSRQEMAFLNLLLLTGIILRSTYRKKTAQHLGQFQRKFSFST